MIEFDSQDFYIEISSSCEWKTKVLNCDPKIRYQFASNGYLNTVDTNVHTYDVIMLNDISLNRRVVYADGSLALSAKSLFGQQDVVCCSWLRAAIVYREWID